MSEGVPNQPEAEASLLACLFLEPDRMGEITGQVTEDWFYAGAHRHVWRALHAFHAEGRAFDPVLIIAWAKANPDEAVRTAVPAIERKCAELTGYLPTAAQFSRYREICEDAAMRRKLMKLSRSLFDASRDAAVPWKEAMDEAEGELFGLRTITSHKGTRHVRDVVLEVVEQFEERHKRRGQATMGVPTGFADIDRMINGFAAPQLITIAARPAMGKTSLLWGFVEGAALNPLHPAKVGFYTLEMSDSEILERALLGRAGVEFSKGRTGMFANSDWTPLNKAAGDIGNAGIWVFDGYDITIGDLCAQIRADRRRHGIEIAYIDYGQLIKASTRQGQRELRIGIMEVWKGLKGLAKSIGIPIVVLAQAGRGADDNPGRPPQLKDLQESSIIEQASDIVAFIHRTSYYSTWERLKEEKQADWEQQARKWQEVTHESVPGEDADKSIGQKFYEAWAQFCIAKHRNGPVGNIDLLFEHARARFRSRTKKLFSNNLEERQQ